MKKTLIATITIAASLACGAEVLDESLFAYSCEMSVPGYAFDTTLQDFPLPVRISEANIPGFSYEDCREGDFAFTDGAGNILPYDIDTWDSSGTSLVWVKVDLGKNARYKFHWGATGSVPANDPTGVWTRYFAVYHMNGLENGVMPDATGNGHDGVPYTSDFDNPYGIMRTEAGESPIVGNCVKNHFASGYTASGFFVSGSTGVEINRRLNISCWARSVDYEGNFGGAGRLFATGSQYSEGVNVTFGGVNSILGAWFMSSGHYFGYKGESDGNVPYTVIERPSMPNVWRHYSVNFIGTADASWGNGVKAFENGRVWANLRHRNFSVWNQSGMAIGGFVGSGNQPFSGDIEEFRIFAVGQLPGDEWIAADYACQADASFVAFAPVVKQKHAGNANAFFSKRAVITIDGYSGASELQNFPLLVKLDQTVAPGLVDEDDFRFADEEGSFLPHEVDTWNASGTSLVWVGVPSLEGSATKIALYWDKNADADEMIANNPHAVWENYLAVFHFSERVGSGYYLDSSANGFIALSPYNGAGGTDIDNGTEAGPLGNCIVNFSGESTAGGMFLGGTRDILIDGRICFSGWTKARDTTRGYRIFACGHGYEQGFNICLCNIGMFSVIDGHFFGEDAPNLDLARPYRFPEGTDGTAWNYVSMSLSAHRAKHYINGGLWCDLYNENLPLLPEPRDVSMGGLFQGGDLAFGSFSDTSGGLDPFDGCYDEMRVMLDQPSADWQAAEYAMQADNSAFLSFSAVLPVVKPSDGLTILIR